MRARAVSLVLGLIIPGSLAAQQYAPKDVLVADFERQKGVLLQYVDAMPDSLYGFAPTPGVRTYAQQIEHIAQATAGVTARATGYTAPLPRGDTEVYLRNRSALRDYVSRSFDHAIAAVQALTLPAMIEEVEMFRLKRPRWRWVIGVQEHTAWTLGSTVPYLRMNGITPPTYLAF